MTEEPYILITADTHAGSSHAQYCDCLDPTWREAFDEWLPRDQIPRDTVCYLFRDALATAA